MLSVQMAGKRASWTWRAFCTLICRNMSLEYDRACALLSSLYLAYQLNALIGSILYVVLRT